jgi:hypothetical protein
VETTAATVEPARTRLNLNPPADWDDIVREVAVPDRRLPFNPELDNALQARTAEVRRRRLVSSRSAAVYGVSDAAYARARPYGTEVKRDGRCVVLVEDRGVEKGARWWASQCTDTQQNPFTLPTIEYDALGRAIAD